QISSITPCSGALWFATIGEVERLFRFAEQLPPYCCVRDLLRRMAMADGTGFDHIRRVDRAKLDSTDRAERYAQVLLDPTTGGSHCSISYIRTPPGGGSPEGMHVHEVDQIFLIVEGTMSIEVGGTTHAVEPGALVVFPAGVPHRNWNAGTQPTVHVAFNV